MEQYKNNNNTYPKSTSGKQCVGPCYKKNTKIIHPMYFNIITDTLNNSFCPVAEFTNINDTTGKIEKYHVDKCIEQTFKSSNPNDSNYVTSTDLLYPFVDFNEETFLKLFYKIEKFSDSIQWIEDNKHTPMKSRKRIFDLSINAFGNSFDIMETSDTRIVDFILLMFKTTYLNKIVLELLKYLNIDNEKKFIEIKKNDKKETDESIIIKTNYINKHIITLENVTNFISKYFRTTHTELRMQSHCDNIANKYIIYITENIKKTFI